MTSASNTPVFDDAAIYAPGEVFALSDVLSSRDEPWFNQALTGVNGDVLRVARLHGEFHHHSHETDELFFIVDGVMEIEIEGTVHALRAGTGVCVPAGAVHRTRADAPATVLLVAARAASMAGQKKDRGE